MLKMFVEVRCRKCRCIVASGKDSDVLETHHVADIRPRGFMRKDGGAFSDKAKRCAHLFVQEQPWMDPVVRNVNSGVLPCPKCAAKLGTFCWSGMQCSCGTWVAPALSFVRSKLDVLEVAHDNGEAD